MFRRFSCARVYPGLTARAVPNSSASAVSALPVPRISRICGITNAFLGVSRRQSICMRR